MNRGQEGHMTGQSNADRLYGDGEVPADADLLAAPGVADETTASPTAESNTTDTERNEY